MALTALERMYVHAHQLVKRARGKADEYECHFCIKPAAQWAYEHTEEDPPMRMLDGRAFSFEPNDYIPACVSCHMRYDGGHRSFMRPSQGRPTQRRRTK